MSLETQSRFLFLGWWWAKKMLRLPIFFSLIISTITLCLETLCPPLPMGYFSPTSSLFHWVFNLQNPVFCLTWAQNTDSVWREAPWDWGHPWSCVVVVHFCHWVREEMGKSINLSPSVNELSVSHCTTSPSSPSLWCLITCLLSQQLQGSGVGLSLYTYEN